MLSIVPLIQLTTRVPVVRNSTAVLERDQEVLSVILVAIVSAGRR